jgi:hypothetical protein
MKPCRLLTRTAHACWCAAALPTPSARVGIASGRFNNLDTVNDTVTIPTLDRGRFFRLAHP